MTLSIVLLSMKTTNADDKRRQQIQTTYQTTNQSPPLCAMPCYECITEAKIYFSKKHMIFVFTSHLTTYSPIGYTQEWYN